MNLNMASAVVLEPANCYCIAIVCALSFGVTGLVCNGIYVVCGPIVADHLTSTALFSAQRQHSIMYCILYLYRQGPCSNLLQYGRPDWRSSSPIPFVGKSDFLAISPCWRRKQLFMVEKETQNTAGGPALPGSGREVPPPPRGLGDTISCQRYCLQESTGAKGAQRSTGTKGSQSTILSMAA